MRTRWSSSCSVPQARGLGRGGIRCRWRVLKGRMRERILVTYTRFHKCNPVFLAVPRRTLQRIQFTCQQRMQQRTMEMQRSGLRRNNTLRVSHVSLPRWCHTTPAHAMQTMLLIITTRSQSYANIFRGSKAVFSWSCGLLHCVSLLTC